MFQVLGDPEEIKDSGSKLSILRLPNMHAFKAPILLDRFFTYIMNDGNIQVRKNSENSKTDRNRTGTIAKDLLSGVANKSK